MKSINEYAYLYAVILSDMYDVERSVERVADSIILLVFRGKFPYLTSERSVYPISNLFPMGAL